MGIFKVKSVIDLSNAQIGTEIQESDYCTLTNDNKFVQLEYTETDSTSEKYDVKPGIFTILKTMQGLKLEPSNFLEDKVLKTFVSTKEITEKIDCFFRNLHKYAKFGSSIPMRRMMFFGPPGCGKSTSVNLACKEYIKDGKTLVISWPTDKYEAWEIKDFITSFNYIGVEKMILVIEDLGGVEMDQVRLKSDSALLSMLTNQDKTFQIPTCVIATTNHVEVFMGNLTNRPGRFDDKIRIDYPDATFRTELFKFYCENSNINPDDEVIKLLASKDCKEFSAAHIFEIIVRSEIHEKTQLTVLNELKKEIEEFKKGFEKRNMRMGIGED